MTDAGFMGPTNMCDTLYFVNIDLFYKPIYSNDIFIDLKFFLDIYIFAFISQDGSSI